MKRCARCGVGYEDDFDGCPTCGKIELRAHRAMKELRDLAAFLIVLGVVSMLLSQCAV